MDRAVNRVIRAGFQAFPAVALNTAIKPRGRHDSGLASPTPSVAAGKVFSTVTTVALIHPSSDSARDNDGTSEVSELFGGNSASLHAHWDGHSFQALLIFLQGQEMGLRVGGTIITTGTFLRAIYVLVPAITLTARQFT